MIMKIHRAYQFRLYPTKEQEVIIRKTFRCTRFVYNYCLDLKKKNNYLTKFDLMKELPRIKEVKIRGYRNLDKISGRILNATIREVGTRFYVSVCVEEEIKLPERKNNQAVGIDIGVKNLVVTSNKEYYGNPRYLEKYEKKIKRFQQELSRKIKGSKNYIKCKKKIEEVYRKLKNARKKTVEEIVAKVTSFHDMMLE